MQNMTKEQIEKQAIIDAYEFKSHLRSEQHEKNYNAVKETMQLLINENLEYLQYAIAKGYFSMTKEEMQNTATHHAIVHVANRLFKWEPSDACKLAFEVLQDVNLHEEAAQVEKLLNLNLKSYEVE